MIESKLFLYNKPDIADHNIIVLTQYHIHQKNLHYSNTIFKHFYQSQQKDTRFIQPSLNLPYIKLDINECNANKDIIANAPTIYTNGNTIEIFDSQGKHIRTITTQRLEWLWNNIIH
jgi:hypothetical protein